MSTQTPKYLLLVRHGAVDRNSAKLNKDQGLDPKGINDAKVTASVLSEQLNEVEGIKHVTIWCSEYRHARDYADFIRKVLKDHGIDVKVFHKKILSPSEFRRWEKEKETVKEKVKKFINTMFRSWKKEKTFINTIKKKLEAVEKDNALMLVGHQPQLGCIVERIHKAIPIARSEIVCIRLNKGYFRKIKIRRCSQRLWSIAPTDDKTMELLRDKIKSKMDTAKLLGTFIVFLLGIVLGILSDEGKLQFLVDSNAFTRTFLGGLCEMGIAKRNEIYLYTIVGSVVSLFSAAVLYLITMYAYDRLLMPTRFWAEGIKARSPRWLPQRPPSSSLLVLQVNMMRIWKLLFTGANILVGLSLAGFSLVVMRADPLEYILGIIALGLLVYLYYRWAKPQLGAED